MKEAVTIHYAGQGYIYRCPECLKVDRMPWSSPPEAADCRFCEQAFKPVVVPSMNAELYGVIQEINTLETGTPFGCSPEMLKENNLVRAGKSVGIDVLSGANQGTSPKKDNYWAPWRLQKKDLRESYKTPEGKEIIETLVPLLMGKHTVEEFLASDKELCKEVYEEARMRVLMKHNQGLTKNQKIALLKKHGFAANVDKKGKVYVFFGSTYAPECDSWAYWD